MDESEKIEKKKKYNAPFFRAFDRLAKDMGKNQQEMASHIGASPSLISDQRNGKKRVGEKYMTNLANAFNAFYQGEAHLYMNFLLGKSQYMLVENVPDSEISENLSREANPDYDVMKSKQQKESSPAQESTYIISKMYESMLKPIQDAHAKLVATLEKQIADKDAQIKQQADVIASLQKVISDLRALPSINIEEIMNRHPFPIGVSESQESPRAQV
jgi:transcriptional regulator with XRE-family HTH domain